MRILIVEDNGSRHRSHFRVLTAQARVDGERKGKKPSPLCATGASASVVSEGETARAQRSRQLPRPSEPDGLAGYVHIILVTAKRSPPNSVRASTRRPTIPHPPSDPADSSPVSTAARASSPETREVASCAMAKMAESATLRPAPTSKAGPQVFRVLAEHRSRSEPSRARSPPST